MVRGGGLLICLLCRGVCDVCVRAANAVHSVGGGGVSEMSRGGVGDAPRRADGRRGWDAGASEDEFAIHTISHLEIGFFLQDCLTSYE